MRQSEVSGERMYAYELCVCVCVCVFACVHVCVYVCVCDLEGGVYLLFRAPVTMNGLSWGAHCTDPSVFSVVLNTDG